LTILTIAGTLAGLALIAVLVATLEHLDCKARERRWQQALASFNMDDGRTALTDPPMGAKRAPVFSLKGPTRL
jgi:hypothetical protein